jgi:hypothetical protein
MTTTRTLTTVGATAVGSSADTATRRRATWAYRHRKVLIAGAVATAATVLAVSQDWIAAANLPSLLLALPCTLMMLKCMSGMHGGRQTEAVPAETPVPPDRS